ncbi:MAG: hypothetical protein WAT93_06590 [Pontixanthobacter sp.]
MILIESSTSIGEALGMALPYAGKLLRRASPSTTARYAHLGEMVKYDESRLYENYASRAVRNGWSAHDLFGVLPWHPGWGGLCDRLQGARNLKMDRDRALWSRRSIRDQTCRCAGDDLLASSLTLIWEL